MKKIILFNLGLVFTLNQTSLGAIFTHTLRGYPKGDISCYDQTAVIGEEFAKATQIKQIHVECAHETKTSYDFAIEYEAPAAISFTATDYVGNPYPKGRYKTEEECLSQLTEQVALFERVTGLSPLWKYCFKNSSLIKPWEIIITAIGSSPMQPHLGGYHFFTNPLNITGEQIFESLKRSLIKNDAVLADLVFRGNFAVIDASIHYYASKHLFFNFEEVTENETPERCLAQVTEFNSWLRGNKNDPWIVYCGGPNLGHYFLQLGTLGNSGFSHQQAVSEFTSFEECESHRAEVVSHYQGDLSKKVLGGLCSKAETGYGYKVILFKQKN